MINGIVYGRGGWRPFFIGGTMAGQVPHLGSLYVSVVGVTEMLDGGGGELFGATGAWPNMLASLTFLAPGPFAILGGLVGVWTWWMFRERPVRPAISSLDGEYVVVSGRITRSPVAMEK